MCSLWGTDRIRDCLNYTNFGWLRLTSATVRRYRKLVAHLSTIRTHVNTGRRNHRNQSQNLLHIYIHISSISQVSNKEALRRSQNCDRLTSEAEPTYSATGRNTIHRKTFSSKAVSKISLAFCWVNCWLLHATCFVRVNRTSSRGICT
jgi:hypothetical protein